MRESVFRGYGIAAFVCIAAVLSIWALGPLLACLLATVLASRQYCSKGPTMVVVAVSTVLAIFALPGPVALPASHEWPGLAIFLVVSTTATFLIPNRRQPQVQPPNELHTREPENHALDAIPGFFWTALPNSELVYVSPNLLEYTGTTFEQVKADRWLVVHQTMQKGEARSGNRGVSCADLTKTGSGFAVAMAYIDISMSEVSRYVTPVAT